MLISRVNRLSKKTRLTRRYATDKIKKDVWWKNGLNFKCTGCGKCCVSEGVVELSPKDRVDIPAYLGIPQTKFMEEYVEIRENEHYILQSKQDKCIFLNDKNQCDIYEMRPIQCSTYPYWSDVLKSKRSWNQEKKYCEGIDHPDSLNSKVPFSKIEKELMASIKGEDELDVYTPHSPNHKK
eukprot:TRINITY_DN618_c0_g1_i1.p1 TRINITY_DN618_c0_g1~~TRINITY_DN618_c0_g1_i1.p1  ORF type:complete len:181 (-),score=30.09 TRINITY_DN618_c0_g1_i1:11-553(-)